MFASFDGFQNFSLLFFIEKKKNKKDAMVGEVTLYHN